jgi:NAD(P)-dependent dehydrogenase (short-subunit alcohol dehydrogenase family)
VIDFHGSVGLVTGATSGIGEATAVMFARYGAKVTVAGRRETDGHRVVNSINASGGKAIFVRTDVQREEDVKELVEITVSTFGRLDCAFNNAGVDHIAPLDHQTTADFDNMISTNLRGSFLCMKYELPAIAATGGGSIVNMSSIAGAVVGIPINAPYSAAKAGIVGLTKSTALSAAKDKITINALCCGSVATELAQEIWKSLGWSLEQVAAYNPLGRIGKPEEIAAAVLFLCSSHASYITGTTLVIDGGYTAQ